MRKVRVWDDVLNEMLYGRVEQFDDMLEFRFEKHLETENPIYMWSTDLKDKNGREIYDGDILIDEENGLNVVRWGGGQYLLEVLLDDGDYYTEWLSDYNEMCRVIGNIFENPELVKGEKNT